MITKDYIDKNSKHIEESVMYTILFLTISELIKILTKVSFNIIKARNSVYNEILSRNISHISGDDIQIHIIKTDKIESFGYMNRVIISNGLIKKLNDRELIAKCLYIYSLIKGRIGKVAIKSIVSTVLQTTIGSLEIFIFGEEAMEKHYKESIAGYIILMAIIETLYLRINIEIAKKYVEKKGYYNDLVSATKKLRPIIFKRDKDTVEVDVRNEIEKASKLLKLINFEKNIENNKILEMITKLKLLLKRKNQ